LALLERARVAVYVPDLPAPHYRNLLRSFEQEFVYAFGGCTIEPGLEGNYLNRSGTTTPERINLIYADLPLALSTNFKSTAHYADELKEGASEALDEESVLVSVAQIYHAI
jgi:hypothetical protein